MPASDDKAELQEFEPIAPKPTLTALCEDFYNDHVFLDGKGEMLRPNAPQNSAAHAVCIFQRGRIWQDPPAGLDVVPDGRGARISGAFMFPMSQEIMPAQALMVDARTSVNEDSPMALEISISVPLPGGGFVFKGDLSYPHQVSAPMVDPAFTSEQRANTLEMVQRVFQAARACCSSTPGSQMESPNILHVDTLETFSVFALSRMYRWGMVELKEGSEALSMLRRDAACQLVCGVGTAPAEVYKWFNSRLILRSPHDVYLDAVLYDIEQSARRRLIDVMSDPPGKDPLGQLSLLSRAVAAHPVP